MLADPSSGDWNKMESLRQIEMIRETNKHTLLNKVLMQSMQFRTTVDVTPGQPSLVHMMLQNPFPKAEVFHVSIEDPDSDVLSVLPTPEFYLVTNVDQEWQFWFNEKKCPRPPGWDIVGESRDVLL